MSSLASLELDRHDWNQLQVMGDRSDRVPGSLRGLVFAMDEDEATLYYWELENTVVVQGQLFEAAPAVVSVLLAALAEGVSSEAIGWVLELLFQLVSGDSDVEAVERGNGSLGDACRNKAREGL